jgi:hypothetical protein
MEFYIGFEAQADALVDAITQEILQDPDSIPRILSILLAGNASYVEELLKEESNAKNTKPSQSMTILPTLDDTECRQKVTLLYHHALFFWNYSPSIGETLAAAVMNGDINPEGAALQLLLINSDSIRKKGELAIYNKTLGGLNNHGDITAFGSAAAIRASRLTGMLHALLGAYDSTFNARWVLESGMKSDAGIRPLIEALENSRKHKVCYPLLVNIERNVPDRELAMSLSGSRQYSNLLPHQVFESILIKEVIKNFENGAIALWRN